MSVILTIEQLRAEYLPKWTRILRLQDWNIDISVKRERDMFTAAVGGCVNFHFEKRHAIIQILDPIDFDPDTPCKPDQDMEQTLVHELLHLHLTQWKEDHKPFEEQAIHAIAQALILLDRARGIKVVSTPA